MYKKISEVSELGGHGCPAAECVVVAPTPPAPTLACFFLSRGCRTGGLCTGQQTARTTTWQSACWSWRCVRACAVAGPCAHKSRTYKTLMPHKERRVLCPVATQELRSVTRMSKFKLKAWLCNAGKPVAGKKASLLARTQRLVRSKAAALRAVRATSPSCSVVPVGGVRMHTYSSKPRPDLALRNTGTRQWVQGRRQGQESKPAVVCAEAGARRGCTSARGGGHTHGHAGQV